MIRKIFSPFLLAALLTLFFLSGCVSNNDRTIQELANHMIRETGGAWFCVMEPGTVHAESGFSLWLENRQIIFYKYNTDKKKMRHWLDYVNKNGRLYIVAQEYPAVAHGSFVMMDYEAFTPETKKKLLDAFFSF